MCNGTKWSIMSWPKNWHKGRTWLQKLKEHATKPDVVKWWERINKKPDVFHKPKPPKNNNPWKNLKSKGGAVGPNGVL